MPAPPKAKSPWPPAPSPQPLLPPCEQGLRWQGSGWWWPRQDPHGCPNGSDGSGMHGREAASEPCPQTDLSSFSSTPQLICPPPCPSPASFLPPPSPGASTTPRWFTQPTPAGLPLSVQPGRREKPREVKEEQQARRSQSSLRAAEGWQSLLLGHQHIHPLSRTSRVLAGKGAVPGQPRALAWLGGGGTSLGITWVPAEGCRCRG